MTDEESGGSLRNHGELRGPQTHRLWVAALADLLKTRMVASTQSTP